MKYLILAILTFVTFSAFAQQEIKLEEVKNHVGDSVKLKAKIYGGKYIESVKGSPTFLNVGDNYPNAPLTLVIWGNVRSLFKIAPEEMYNKGYVQWIVGKIELYKGKPEIVITNPNQVYDVVAAPIGK
jgi:DNA/RNA endonuclease YhcR with UshA esterase domain